MAGRYDKTALDLVEEAIYLVRNAPLGAVAAYYVGTLPFLLAFLYFWADMSRSSMAYQNVAPAGLGLAALFLWMSAWQAVFAQALRSSLTGTTPARFSRVALVQATLQPTKLIALPVAVLVTVPLGAVFAFYQNLMAVSYDESQGMREVFASAQRQARLWQTQNWALLGFVCMLAVVVFLNIGVLLLIGPQLLKSLLGFETAVTRGETLMMNSTFLAITTALTYAIVDPLIKAIYVLRCFYGESVGTGEDLKAQLKSIAAQILLVIVVGMAAGGTLLHAQPQHQVDPQTAGVHGLDRSIDDVLKRQEFSWRLPHRRQPNEDKSWFSRVLFDFLDRLDHWLDDFFRWLHNRFSPDTQLDQNKKGLPKVTTWVYALLGVLVVIVVVLFVRLLRKRPRAVTDAEPLTTAAVDLASDDTRADQLPADEWLRTARECVARNDLRLAVRALYLANLAYLGTRSLIAIDRGKSNNDYARELRRRARGKPEVVPVFSDTIGVFERSWYGMHDVDAGLVERVEANLSTMRSHVEQ